MKFAALLQITLSMHLLKKRVIWLAMQSKPWTESSEELSKSVWLSSQERVLSMIKLLVQKYSLITLLWLIQQDSFLSLEHSWDPFVRFEAYEFSWSKFTRINPQAALTWANELQTLFTSSSLINTKLIKYVHIISLLFILIISLKSILPISRLI